MKILKFILLFSIILGSASTYSQTSVEEEAVKAFNDKKYDKAYIFFSQALEREPHNADFAYYTVWCANAVEDYSQASFIASQFLTNQWNHKVAIEYAYALKNSGNYIEAVDIYQKILASDRNNPYVNYQLGLTWKAMKENHKALGQFKYCIENNLYLAESYYEAGCLYNANYDLENAKYYLQEAIKHKERYADAYFELGMAFFASQNTYLALDNIYTATQIDPLNPLYTAKIGDMYFSNLTMKSYEKALHYYLASIENKTDDAGVYFKTGWIYNHIKDYANAIKYLTTATEMQPDKKDFWVELGYAYYYSQSYKEAILVLNKALVFDPKDDFIIYLLAKSYKDIGDQENFDTQKQILRNLHSVYEQKL